MRVLVKGVGDACVALPAWQPLCLLRQGGFHACSCWLRGLVNAVQHAVCHIQ